MTAIREIIESEKYKDVLFVVMWVLSFKDEKGKTQYLSNLYNEFIRTERNLEKGEDNSIFFIRSLGRDDYSLMFSSIISAASNYKTVKIETFRKEYIESNIEATTFLQDHIDLLEKIQVSDPLDQQCAFMVLISYGFILEKYAKNRPIALVCFSDMQPIEALFSIYFKSKGIPTVTVQHGLYIDYSEYKTVNALNYLSHNSDYFLAWGEETANLIHSYNPDKDIFLCGKPNIHNKKQEGSNRKGYILVVLDQNIFKIQNFQLIKMSFELATQKELDIFFRFHPGIAGPFKKEYTDAFPNIKEYHDLHGAELVVGHTSSLLFEALELNKKVLQYKTDIPTIDLPKELQFKDFKSLESSFTNYKPTDYSKTFFEAVGGKSKINYKDFFDWLIVGSVNVMPKRFIKKTNIIKERPAWVFDMENKFYARSKKLGSIVIPCLKSDLDALYFMLNAWTDERLLPRVTKGAKPHLIIVFNRADAYVINKAKSFWMDIPKLSLYFSGLSVKSADLYGDSDIYIKDRPKDKGHVGKYGNVAGPNFLFQKAMNYASDWPGYTLQIEIDCFPLEKDWLSAVERVINRSNGAWVIGSMYLGTFRINDPIKLHLNGNALYNAGDSNFIEFLNKIWLPRLIKYKDKNPNIAYDLWWAIENHEANTKYLDEDSGWNIIRNYSSFFYNDPFIMNFLESDDHATLIKKYYNHFTSLKKEPVFLHSKYSKDNVEMFLKSNKNSFLDYLTDNLEKKVNPVSTNQSNLLIQMNVKELEKHNAAEKEIVINTDGVLPYLNRELSLDTLLNLINSEPMTKDLARFFILSITTKLICADDSSQIVSIIKLDKNIINLLRKVIAILNKDSLKTQAETVFKRYGIEI